MNIIKKISHKIFKIFHPEMGRILMLHRVVEKRSVLDENKKIEITPSFLESEILRYKNKGYRFVSLDQVCDIVNNKKKGRKFVCLTFDDGYSDNFEMAYPILEKHQCPFSVAVTTDFYEHKAFIWWYILEDILTKNDKIVLHDGTVFDNSTIDMKNKNFAGFRDKIFALPQNEIENTFRKWFDKYEFVNPVADLALSKKQIIDLSKNSLCSIISHTVSHPFLPRMSREEQFFELSESKKKLEQLTGKQIRHLAYPYGMYNDDTLDAMKECGYESGMITWGGAIKRGDNEMLELKRMELHQNDN